jgi:ribonuclease HI
MDKGHNNHPQNERCDVILCYAQSIPLSIDAFYEKEEEKFMKILRV